MKIEVKDHKVELITKLLKHIPFVKMKASEEPKERQREKPVTPHQQGKGRQLTFL